MELDRNFTALIRWSTFLAACGALIFVIAASFVGLLLWHLSLVGDNDSTFIIVHTQPLSIFVGGSALILIASLFTRHIATHRQIDSVKRLSQIAILATAVGWFTIGAALFWLRAR